MTLQFAAWVRGAAPVCTCMRSQHSRPTPLASALRARHGAHAGAGAISWASGFICVCRFGYATVSRLACPR
eukprot:15473080-Alexandrium_andersonii.AAC.1